MTPGAVLCGGRSRRMGTDKALLRVDGVPMAERVARALAAAGCDPVVFVGGDVAALAAAGRPAHPDAWPDEGPVGGILTAMDVLGDDVVVAACDLPDLDAATVAALLARGEPGCDVVVAMTDRVQPTLAWWRAGSRAPVAAAFAAGARALHEVMAHLRVVTVTVAPAALRNVNRPGDLA